MDLDRKARFEEIKEAYDSLEEDKKLSGKPLVFDTERGIFGAMTCDRTFTFFERIDLWRYDHFIDIGSGDGRVVLLASLFTNAEGIEIDEDLCEEAETIRDALDIDPRKAKIMRKDFFDHDFSKYQIIFINPDKGWHKGLEEKLLREMRDDAILYVNNEVFLPEKLVKGRKLWFDGVPIIEYRKGRNPQGS